MSDNAKAILEAVARASSKVMNSADKAVPTNQCPNCGYEQENRADTDLPPSLHKDPNSESSYDK